MQGDSSSDDEPRLPPNVLNSQRRGWAGGDLEIEHQREAFSGGGEKKSQTAAVDLSQFRNEEVGKGYQAKHVVRQREATTSSTGVVDMSGGAFGSRDDDRKEKKSSAHKKEKKSSKRKRGSGDEMKNARESYLQCKGLETFLGDVDKMLAR